MRIEKKLNGFDIPELKPFVERVLSAYLKGKLPPKEIAQKLATHMEVEAAREVLNRLVEEGRIDREEAESIIKELQSQRFVENGAAATVGVCTGGGAALTMVSASGT